MQKSPQ